MIITLSIKNIFWKSDQITSCYRYHLTQWDRHEKRCSVCMIKGPILCTFAMILAIFFSSFAAEWELKPISLLHPWHWGPTCGRIHRIMGPLSKQLVFIDLMASELLEEEEEEEDTDWETDVLAFARTLRRGWASITLLSVWTGLLCQPRGSSYVRGINIMRHPSEQRRPPRLVLLLWLCMFVPHRA